MKSMGLSINNFQNRMNCYSYALQTYYAGELSQGEYYKLYLSTSNLSIV